MPTDFATVCFLIREWKLAWRKSRWLYFWERSKAQSSQSVSLPTHSQENYSLYISQTYEVMASPFQTPVGGQPHLPTHQAYPGSQGLVMGAHPAIVPEGQNGMETSAGMNPISGQQPPIHRDFNMALLCRVGQETVQEIVSKTTELFQTLKLLQPPNGMTQSLTGQEERKAKLQDNLRNISICFKKLKKIYEKCNENCAGMEYTHIEVDSLVPLKDEIDSRQEDKKSTEVKCLTEEHRLLVEQVMLRNRQLKEVIDNLRSFIWDINTMLSVRKP